MRPAKRINSVTMALLAVLSGCTSVSVTKIGSGSAPIVGSYPYALARTSLLLTISVTLTGCGAKQNDAKTRDVRPVMGLTEDIAVISAFEPDPGQIYAVPYDRLRRVFGKETQITVNLNPNGTLSGINGTVNDQYGPGAVAVIDTAVKVAAGVMVPAAGIAMAGSAVAKAVAGGPQEASALYGHSMRQKPKYKKVDRFCTNSVLAALDAIDAANQDAAKYAAKDAAKKSTLPSPQIAKDQAEIVRLQTENQLTRTVRLVWTPTGTETPDSKNDAVAMFSRQVDLYGSVISGWLSPTGQGRYAKAIATPTDKGVSDAERTSAMMVTQPITLQFELRRFTMGTPLPTGEDGDKVDETKPTEREPAGIVLRDPAQGIIRLCRGPCVSNDQAPENTGGEIKPPAAVAMGQFGRTLVFHIKNRLFENSNFSISLASDGSIASLGNHTTGTLPSGLATLGSAGSDAVTNYAAYNTALAAGNTNLVNHSALTDTINKNLADCYMQQAAVRKAGGIPIGTCN